MAVSPRSRLLWKRLPQSQCHFRVVILGVLSFLNGVPATFWFTVDGAVFLVSLEFAAIRLFVAYFVAVVADNLFFPVPLIAAGFAAPAGVLAASGFLFCSAVGDDVAFRVASEASPVIGYLPDFHVLLLDVSVGDYGPGKPV